MEHELSRHKPFVQSTEPPPFWRSRYAIGLLIMGAIATYFLLGEHRAHFLGALPLLLLLSCPLMHVFMHHGHVERGDDGGHAHHHAGEVSANPSAAAPTPPSGNRP